MSFLRELVVSWREKGLRPPTWQETVKQFDLDFLTEYYRLPTGESILGDFIATAYVPDEYIRFCQKYTQEALKINLLLEPEIDHLDEACRQLRLKGKEIPLEMANSDVSNVKGLLRELLIILQSVAGPASLLVANTLRELYYCSPAIHLPGIYNHNHDIYWRGVGLEGNTPRSPNLFMVRIFNEPYVLHPESSEIYKPGPRGNPIPRPAEVICHKGWHENPDFSGIFVEMDLLYWFSLTTHKYDAASLSGERRQEGYGDIHGSAVPRSTAKLCAKGDPVGFVNALQSYGKNILLPAYKALPRKLVKIG